VTESCPGSQFDVKGGASNFNTPPFLPFGLRKVLSSTEGLKGHARYSLFGAMVLRYTQTIQEAFNAIAEQQKIEVFPVFLCIV
jgi:hypothetical protein